MDKETFIMENYVVNITGTPEMLNNGTLNEYYRVIKEVDNLCSEFGLKTEVELFINKRRVFNSWGDYENKRYKHLIRIFPKGLESWIGRKPAEEQQEIMTVLLLHEIAHHIVELERIESKGKAKSFGKSYRSHGREWKAIFRMILNRCGYDIEGTIKATGLDNIIRI